jgi:hypothetical protein
VQKGQGGGGGVELQNARVAVGGIRVWFGVAELGRSWAWRVAAGWACRPGRLGGLSPPFF